MAEGDVVRMEPFIVRAFRLPRTDEIQWLTPHGQDVKLAKDYLSSFDRDFLNRFTLPIIGVTPAARARAMDREAERLKDLNWMTNQIKALRQADPAAAKGLTEIRDDLFTRTGP